MTLPPMPSTNTNKPNAHRKSASASSAAIGRTSNALQKTEILINVYDLLPPGRLSSFLWAIGGSLLHSGVVINDKEYAYGGHNRRGVTGVYWTRPQFEPPGGTFRITVLQGFTFRSPPEIDAIIKEVSDQFLGRNYNLLTFNCNHFTNALCERLTSKAAPAWINRAASIGLALPCVVPREWVSPPDHETADGELLDDEDGEDERAAMLSVDSRRKTTAREQEEEEAEEQRRRRRREQEQQKGSLLVFADEADDGGSAQSLAGGRRLPSGEETVSARPVSFTDSSGREIPPAERAPMPRR